MNRNNNYLHGQPHDYGPEPFIIDIEKAAQENTNYRAALWTGRHLQLTLMSIPVGGEIGLEMHSDTDQFLRIEIGHGIAMMGPSEKQLNNRQIVCSGYAVFVPAGTWHNIVNTGNCPLKIYTIYARRITRTAPFKLRKPLPIRKNTELSNSIPGCKIKEQAYKARSYIT